MKKILLLSLTLLLLGIYFKDYTFTINIYDTYYLISYLYLFSLAVLVLVLLFIFIKLGKGSS